MSYVKCLLHHSVLLCSLISLMRGEGPCCGGDTDMMQIGTVCALNDDNVVGGQEYVVETWDRVLSAER